MAHIHVVESLHARGLDYDVISTISGESFTSIQNASNGTQELEASVLEKLGRLETVLDSLDSYKAEIFEKHVLSSVVEGEKTWMFLYEIWGNALISDEELTKYLSMINDYTPVETVENYRAATPTEYMGFRSQLLSELLLRAA